MCNTRNSWFNFSPHILYQLVTLLSRSKMSHPVRIYTHILSGYSVFHSSEKCTFCGSHFFLREGSIYRNLFRPPSKSSVSSTYPDDFLKLLFVIFTQCYPYQQSLKSFKMTIFLKSYVCAEDRVDSAHFFRQELEYSFVS